GGGSDAAGGRVLGRRARDGGEGAGGARGGEGGRGAGDRGAEAHVEDGVHGGGDVQEALGRGAGGGQHRGALEGHQEGRSGARAGAVQTGLDHPAHQVRVRGVRALQGRRRAAHA